MKGKSGRFHEELHGRDELSASSLLIRESCKEHTSTASAAPPFQA